MRGDAIPSDGHPFFGQEQDRPHLIAFLQPKLNPLCILSNFFFLTALFPESGVLVPGSDELNCRDILDLKDID